jgi:hypothetical protein
MLGSFLLLFVLSALAAVAALGVAIRLRPSGRAEMLLAIVVLWTALVALPIYALGLARAVTPAHLALGSAAVSFATLAAVRSRRPLRPWATELAKTAASLLRLPVDAVRLAWRERSIVLVGLVFFYAVIVWTLVQAYFAPASPAWDCLWYHEPKIGFFIQNHGFSEIALPRGLQKINGYPSLCELTQAWFVIFTDRRIVDVANALYTPALALCGYVLAYRRSREQVLAIGWGLAVALLPAALREIQSTFVDAEGAVFVVAGVHFATRPEYRLRDAAVTALCVTLAVASKSTSLAPAGVTTIIALARLVRLHARPRPRATFALAAAASALILAAVAQTYLRNWLWFHNPLWPDARVNIDALNIHWPGDFDFRRANMQYGGHDDAMDYNLRFRDLITDLYAFPYSVHVWQVDEVHGYGIAFAWVILPLGLLGIVIEAVVAARLALMKRFGREIVQSRLADAYNALLVALPLLAILLTSQALWRARLNIASVALFVPFAHWFTSTPTWRRLGEGAVAISVATHVMMSWWAQPQWWVSPEKLAKMMATPYPQREMMPEFGSAISLRAGQLREAQLVDGTLAVFTTDEASVFPTLFWNNRYSNRVAYVPSGPTFVADALALNPTWIVLDDPNPAIRVLEAKGWVQEGNLYDSHGVILAAPTVSPR